MSHLPDPRAAGLSTHDYCALLPRRRYSHEARGCILLLPRTGLAVVPFEQQDGGGWYAIVVEGNERYPAGGHDLSISRAEIETAVELTSGEPVINTLVATVTEAEALDDGDYILTRTHGSLRKTIVDGETRWTRSILNKVSLRTDELAAELPAVVRSGASAKEPSRV